MKVVVFLCCLAAALAGTYTADVRGSFCGQYGGNTTAGQSGLLDAVIDVTVGGCGTGTWGTGANINNACPVGANVQGLIQQNSNKNFFNGQSAFSDLPNYTNNTVAYNALRLKLNQFFALALGCFAITPVFPSRSMYDAHHRLGITATMMNDFFGSYTTGSFSGMLGALAAFGVSMGAGESSEIGFLAGIKGLLGAPLAGCDATQPFPGDPCAFSVCSDASCPPRTDFYSFVASGNQAWVDGFAGAQVTQKPTIVIGRGGSVAFRWNGGPPNHFVQQEDAIGGAVTASGFSSGTTSSAAGTYTHTFATPGTYYARCGVHTTAMEVTINVAGSPASTLLASLSTVAVAMLAAIALKQ